MSGIFYPSKLGGTQQPGIIQMGDFAVGSWQKTIANGF